MDFVSLARRMRIRMQLLGDLPKDDTFRFSRDLDDEKGIAGCHPDQM
jgi:hypothetical protein